MSNNLPNSLLMNVFRAAVVLLGIAITLTLTVELLRRIWPWLIGIGCTLAVLTAALVAWRARRNQTGW